MLDRDAGVERGQSGNASDPTVRPVAREEDVVRGGEGAVEPGALAESGLGRRARAARALVGGLTGRCASESRMGSALRDAFGAAASFFSHLALSSAWSIVRPGLAPSTPASIASICHLFRSGCWRTASAAGAATPCLVTLASLFKPLRVLGVRVGVRDLRESVQSRLARRAVTQATSRRRPRVMAI